MGRAKKWILGKFQPVKLKIYSETKNRYKHYCKSKGRTMQEDLEKYIINCLNK